MLTTLLTFSTLGFDLCSRHHSLQKPTFLHFDDEIFATSPAITKYHVNQIIGRKLEGEDAGEDLLPIPNKGEEPSLSIERERELQAPLPSHDLPRIISIKTEIVKLEPT
ncbi:hypothetical protein VNO77_21092 [Canavalia gladiata]|uniref:Uncharacterized protein n=1 Tax=Canavalia gladiata TaxID=3824 RepID=A0AAN9LQF4_CANGL